MPTLSKVPTHPTRTGCEDTVRVFPLWGTGQMFEGTHQAEWKRLDTAPSRFTGAVCFEAEPGKRTSKPTATISASQRDESY